MAGTTPTDSERCRDGRCSGYRSLCWIRAGHEGAYWAFGYQGQSCYIIPKHQTVVVRFASDLEPPDEGGHLAWEITRALGRL